MELDVATRALLKVWLLPPGLLLILLLLAWLFARRRFGRFLLLTTIVISYLLCTPAGSGWLAGRLESVRPTPLAALKRSDADAILVFLADARDNNPELGGDESLSSLSLERIDFALSLHRHTGLPIILSGGVPPDQTRSLAALAQAWLRRQAGVDAAALDGASRDTWENAMHSAVLLRERGLHRPLLVTHAFHMPRALLSARAAGIDPIPAPFAFLHRPGGPDAGSEALDWAPQARSLANSYLVLHEIIGLVWYDLARR